jgi:two-component system chemotaxis sensor kinase CheA
MPIPGDDFIRRLRATFQVEAEEHLQAIANLLLALEKAPAEGDRQAALETVYREAHSLKGAARAVDLTDVESICQAMETVFSAWKKQNAVPTAGALDVLHGALDVTRLLLGPSPAAHGARHNSLLAQLARLEPMTEPPAPGHSATRASPAPPVSPAASSASPGEPAGDSALVEAMAPSEAARAPEPERSAVTDTVRIAIEKLDAQLLRVEDLLPLKGLVAQRAQELRTLSTMLEEWQTRWARVSAEAQTLLHAGDPATPRGAAAGSADAAGELAAFLEWNTDFHRSLETRVRSLATLAQRERHQVSKRLDELLEDSKKLLMLPFSTLAAVFPKVVRDLCREQGKECDLVVHGGEVEIDKRILEEMKDALIHILRNSVDHGIEAPAERARLHKQPRGTVTLAVSPVNGSKVEILISDDGAGIDTEAVRQAAVRRGARASAEVAGLPRADVLRLVFDSEVSTRQTVTRVSGRGLGMAIVRSKVEKLGGLIHIESTPNAGTTLRIILPLTLATFRGILVSAAERTFVIPATSVQRALRVRPSDIQSVENREAVIVDGRLVSLVRLADVLELPPPPSLSANPRDPAAVVSVMVLHSAGERIAFAVDEVLQEEEVLIKPLRKPLVRVRNIGGATVLASGRAVPTLNVADLVKSARLHRLPPAAAPAPAAPSSRRILVVEDSITSRMLLKGILESAGYSVEVAVDGMDAFTRLRESSFDLVVSDVEMPHLNGFDLTARIRADKRLAEVPVVLVTALESREQRERGIDVGADAYIVKSSFDQSNLLEAVGRLL